MASRLRIARLDPTAFTPLSATCTATSELHQRLQAAMRRHLPSINASLLAAPKPTADGKYIEWYTDLAGQPIPLQDLPPAAQGTIKALLEDRLSVLLDLAERLPKVDPGAADLAEPLRQALFYPGDAAVYTLGGQPVITFWGHRAVSGPPPVGPMPRPITPAAAGAAVEGPLDETTPPNGTESGEGGRGVRWLWLPLFLLLLGAIGVGAWWYFRDLRWPPWVDYEGVLLVARNEETGLRARLGTLESELRGRLDRCALEAALGTARRDEVALLRQLVALQTRLARALELCPLRQAIETAQAEEQALQRRAASLETKLADALNACKRKAQEAEQRRRQTQAQAVAKAVEEKAKPNPKPKQPKPTQKALPPCPGERPPEEAPDVAVVLDSSGSMRFPADMRRQDIIQGLFEQVLGLPRGMLSGFKGPSRLKAAQKAVNNVVRGLPGDVDVGLMVLENCPSATNYGFFSGTERPRLYSKVNRLRPMKKTPLADGIARAGNVVDGVRAPAVIVVVSDGEDTCMGNPCAVARALKARKPKLTINVVDIIGDGKSNCIAHATGGKVLTPQSGMAFEHTIKQATKEAQKPAHCR